MKKLMIAAAIVCAAAFAQAATYDWTASSSMYMTEGEGLDGWELEGYSVYAFDANKYALTTFVSDITTKGVDEALGHALVPNEGEVNTVEYQTFAFVGTGIGDDGATGTPNINAYLAVISPEQADGKQYFHVYELDPIPATPIIVEGGAPLDIGEHYIDEIPGMAGQTYWTAAAVPEPTSGLLLLLGVAGLALKRRRA